MLRVTISGPVRTEIIEGVTSVDVTNPPLVIIVLPDKTILHHNGQYRYVYEIEEMET